MFTQNDIARLDGADVYDIDGDKIGSVGQVYLDAENGNPEWVTVKTGLFGTKETFVPLRDATVTDDRITVGYDKARVKDAPRIDADGPLSHTEEANLYTYYGLAATGTTGYQETGVTSGYQETGVTSGTRETGVTSGTQESGFTAAGRDTSGPTTDDAMTRSEERLVAGTRTEEAGKARLRKYVVTEQQQVDVAVSHDEVRLEREPITDANIDQALSGPDISEEEHEVTLRAERPVVETETVPVERVRLGKETVTEQQTVGGEVRKEQIEFDGPDGRDRL